MHRLYAYAIPAGTFYICWVTRCYFVMLESRLIDSHPTAECAAQSLAANRDIALPSNFKFDELAIPADLGKWSKL